jgi:3-oxoacyl-[acyl-carrier protein] reductase
MDVATAVAWLVAPETSWITGQTIPVNGGYSTS